MFRSTMLTRKESVAWMRLFSTLEYRVPRAGFVQDVADYEHFTRSDAAQAAQASRRKHHLATMDDQELRETRQLLLLSLQEIACTFSKYAIAAKEPQPPSLPSDDTSSNDSKSPPMFESLENTQIQYDSTSSIERIPENTNRTHKSKVTTPSLERALSNAVFAKNVTMTKHLFHESTKLGQVLPERLLCRVFNLVVHDDPSLALIVAKHARRGYTMTERSQFMFFELCSSIGSMDFRCSRYYIEGFLVDLLQELETMDRDEKQEILPKLITGIARQKYASLGTYAGELYSYMVENNYEMRPGWLKQLLELSKYNRQEDLPFHDILDRLSKRMTVPHPTAVMQSIHNMYPFTDTQKICVTLQALRVLQDNFDLEHHSWMGRQEEIQIDIDCLEAISMGAAKSGSLELIRLIWEVLEQCNYLPTEAIYENTVMAFARGGENLEKAFVAINAMKEGGFEVSLALLRSFSVALRSETTSLNKGMKILNSSNDLISLETLNAMMSCYAERGDVMKVFDILRTIRLHNLKPDVNSYSFAMEVLGKEINKSQNSKDTLFVQKKLDDANKILDMMETDGITPSRDLTLNYIKLLCLADELDTAKLVVDDLMKVSPNSVCSMALYQLVKANLDKGDLATSKELASRISDNMPDIQRMIRSYEERTRHTKKKFNRTTMKRLT